jgi:uncharacterized membrane protein YbhN (UPF0104 family)
MDRQRRRRLVFSARLLVSGGLLALLLTKIPDLDGILPNADHGRTAAFLVLAFAFALVGVVLSAWRWQRVLAVFGERLPLASLLSTYVASLFVGNVLPSTIGGDVLRVTRIGRRIGSTETAFASVALERLTGFLALPMLVFAGFALSPSLIDENHALVALLIALIALSLLGSIVFLAGHPRLAGRFANNENWTRFIGAVHLGVDGLRRGPRRIVDVLVTALLYQCAVVASVALIATALDLAVPIAAIIAFVPAVAMVQVLPLSISGLGVREGMLVFFLTPLEVSRAQSIGLGLLWYASLLLISALGAPSFLAGDRKTAPVEASAS